MSVKIKLKNRENLYVTIDQKSFDDIQSNKYLISLEFLENIRAHSSGYGVYQRCITTKKGPVYETIYLHKYVAEKFVKKPESDKKQFIRFIDGDVLNAQIDNLEWVTMSTLRRQMKNTKSATGHRGVTKEKGKYRAIIYDNRKGINLGFHKTAKEAALAYSKKSIELFGHTKSLNDV